AASAAVGERGQAGHFAPGSVGHGRVVVGARRAREAAWIGKWRKATGVEPAWERLTPPTGFEARPRHRARLPSLGAIKLPRRWLRRRRCGAPRGPAAGCGRRATGDGRARGG